MKYVTKKWYNAVQDGTCYIAKPFPTRSVSEKYKQNRKIHHKAPPNAKYIKRKIFARGGNLPSFYRRQILTRESAISAGPQANFHSCAARFSLALYHSNANFSLISNIFAQHYFSTLLCRVLTFTI